jgi:hypothetical protein
MVPSVVRNRNTTIVRDRGKQWLGVKDLTERTKSGQSEAGTIVVGQGAAEGGIEHPTG